MTFGSNGEPASIPERLIMTNSAGPEGQPPAAWVWSQYRGVAPAEAARAVDPGAPPAAADLPRAAAPAAVVTGAAAPVGHSSLLGLGLAAAVILIAGVTWLFTGGTASSPAPPETPAATESAPQKSEAAPPAVEPAAATAPTEPTPAAAAAPAEEAKPAAPAPAPAKKHKKHKHEG
jgi:hypothetical protein